MPKMQSCCHNLFIFQNGLTGQSKVIWYQHMDPPQSHSVSDAISSDTYWLTLCALKRCHDSLCKTICIHTHENTSACTHTHTHTPLHGSTLNQRASCHSWWLLLSLAGSSSLFYPAQRWPPSLQHLNQYQRKWLHHWISSGLIASVTSKLPLNFVPNELEVSAILAVWK